MENVQTWGSKLSAVVTPFGLHSAVPPLTTILEMGEWQTNAALTYIDSSSVDAKTLIKHTVAAFDDEGA